jgi:hypothetical protein
VLILHFFSDGASAQRLLRRCNRITDLSTRHFPCLNMLRKWLGKETGRARSNRERCELNTLLTCVYEDCVSHLMDTRLHKRHMLEQTTVNAYIQKQLAYLFPK